MKRLFLFLFSVLVLQATATEIPVFRYALERWIPEPYTLIVTHSENLNEEQKKLLTKLNEVSETFYSEAYYGGANISVKTVNLAKDMADMSDENKEYLTKAFNGTLADTPKFALISPFPQATVWIDDFTADKLKYLIHSPARQAIVHHVMRGVTGVWLMIDGADAVVNDSTEKEIRTYSASIKEEVPEPRIGDSYKHGRHYVQSDVPLLLEFEVIRIKADNPKEKCIIQILKNPDVARALEIDPTQIGVKPLAIPLFGRGRSFYGLADEDIIDENIYSFCGYLLGNCSCQVKMQNPGIDFLFDGDWLEMLVGEAEIPALPTPEEMLPPPPEVTKEAVQSCDSACTQGCPLGCYNYFVLAGILIVLLLVIIIKRKKRSSKEPQ